MAKYLTPIEMAAVKGRLRAMLEERMIRGQSEADCQSEAFALQVAIRAVEQSRRVIVRGSRSDHEPMPFTVAEALDALQFRSGGRFAPSRPSAGRAITITAIIRRYPDLKVWERIGEWFASGGESYRGTIDTRAVTQDNFDAWALHSQKWVEAGKPKQTSWDKQTRPPQVADIPLYPDLDK
jgi:hypothetical protein